MTIIKIIYDDGSNGMVRVARQARRQRKCIHEMSAAEIINTSFGTFR